MWSALTPFSKSDLNLEFKAKAWLETGMLKVAFELNGATDQLLLPKSLPSPIRVIGLWESTCFEMFIKNSFDQQYLEFNVTSEYNWNVFTFPNRRAQLKEYQEVSNLAVSAEKKPNNFYLSYWLALDRLPPNFWSDGNMEIGLTAVLENKNAELTYWALKHSETQPNFHNEESFIYSL